MGILRRKGLGIFAPVAILAFLASPVSASSYVVSEESEWNFTVSETETVYIYGNSNRSCSQPGADPYLWLYNSSGNLVAQNDDGNHSFDTQCVSSKIVISLQPDTYTIRAGYCCSQRTLGTNPTGGYTYDLLISGYDLEGGTPTTTTTVPTTTTTSTSTTTTTTSTTTTTTSTSTTTTTTTLPPTTTTTSTTSTTTLPPTTTSTTTTSTTTTSSTIPQWTTTTAPPTTTSTVPPTTSTSTTTSSSTSTTTSPPTTSTTTTVLLPLPTSTTTTSTTSSTTTTTSTSTTTTTSAPNTTIPAPTTIPIPQTTNPTTTVQQTPTTVPAKPANLALLPDDIEIQEEPEDGVLDLSDLENVDSDEVLLISKIEDQQLAEDVAHILDGEVSVDDILEAVSSDNFDQLDSGVKQAIAEELSDQPKEVKEAFEEEVNIFEGGFDDYVPQDSRVDVGTRRVVTAVTTIAVVIPAASSGASGSSGNSSSRGRGK